MWTQSSAFPELWRRRCYSAEAVMLAKAMAWRAIDELRRTHSFRVLREPKANIVVNSLGRYAIVTARVRYQDEDKLTYAKRFYRITPLPVVEAKK